ncbi:MAG: zinc ribbon domain-containing protein [Lysobacterales bacterium]
MPIYEFECLSCGKRFDRLQKMSDPDPTDCPVCGPAEIKRALTAAAFRLKGGGWYETDFKGENDKKRNLVEGSSGGGEAKAEGGSSESAKSESKPETKAETKTETKVEKPASPPPAAAAS